MKIKNVGLYFGSFNPVHIGHLITTSYTKEHLDLDEVWLCLTPQNPLKNHSNEVTYHERLTMLKMAVNGCDGIKVHGDEKTLNEPNYTIDTLNIYKKQHPDITFSLIIGEDNFDTFNQWKNYKEILDNFQLIVLVRPHDKEITMKLQDWVHCQMQPAFLDSPIIDLNSTFIRNEIKNKHNIHFYVPKNVETYINKNKLYI